jgi:hypothetical protein
MHKIVLMGLCFIAILFFQCATTGPAVVETIPEPAIRYMDTLYTGDYPDKEYSWDLSAHAHISMPVNFLRTGTFEIKMGYKQGCKFYINKYVDDLKSTSYTTVYKFNVSESVLQDQKTWHLHVVNESSEAKMVDLSLHFKPAEEVKPPEKPKESVQKPAVIESPKTKPEQKEAISKKPEIKETKKEAVSQDPDAIARDCLSEASQKLSRKEYAAALSALHGMPDNAGSTLKNDAKMLREEILNDIFQDINRFCDDCDEKAKKLLPLLEIDEGRYVEAKDRIDSTFPCGGTQRSELINLGQLAVYGDIPYSGTLPTGGRQGFEITMKNMGDLQILIEDDFEVEGEDVTSGYLVLDPEGHRTKEPDGQEKEWMKYSWLKVPGNRTIKFTIINRWGQNTPYHLRLHLYPH